MDVTKMTDDELIALLAKGTIKPEVFQVENNRRREAAVSAAKTNVKTFKIGVDSAKGIYAITVSGSAMPLSVSDEGLAQLVENAAALKAAHEKHGTERRATRAAYKLTDEYKQSADKMFAQASAAKKKAA